MRTRTGPAAMLAALAALMLSGPGRAGAAAAAVPPAPAAAAAPAANPVLARFLNGLTTLRARFTQTVTDAKGATVESGQGSLLLQRPGRFRWDYEPNPPGGSAAAAADAGQRGQLLVADGKNLWYYDRELEQVTVRPIGAALTATPIMLLSGSPEQLEASFEVTMLPSREQLQWVQVKPRSAEADFTVAELGFKGQELVRMRFHDSLGQTVLLQFSRSQRNRPIDPVAFRFQVPPGVDLIGTPER